jgi:hypothetical protein
LVFHAFFLPVFEGPDEPFHLARTAAFADAPFFKALSGRTVPPEIVEAILANPCGPALSSVGCRPFDRPPATFNITRLAPGGLPAVAFGNYEAHQPPLSYLVSGALLRALEVAVGRMRPEIRLLVLRLLSVLFVAVALFGPLRAVTRNWSPVFRAVGLLALLTPGAAEALARCSNDALLFLWASTLVWALAERPCSAAIPFLLAIGAFVKMTALPVVLFGAVALWSGGRRRAASAGLLGALLVFPLQLLRGWAWGGTYELSRPGGPLQEPLGGTVLGFGRSVYTFLKTTFWVGGWSFFRAPVLLVAAFGFLLLGWATGFRPRPDARRRLAHAAGLFVALVGSVALAFGNRKLFGVWGGLGGWYVWGWAPWLALACDDLLTWRRGSASVLLGATGVFVLLANVLWFYRALSLYG